MVTNTDYMNMYPYTGVGSIYEISFDYDVTSNVWVFWLSPTGELSPRKVEDVDYSISNESGVIVLKVLIDFGVDGHILMLRKMPYTQTWQGIDGTTPSPAGIMAALDRIVWQMQQVQGQTEGALHIPMYERMDMEIPALDARKGKIAGYDENGFPNVVGSFAIVPVSEYVKPGLTKETEEDFHEYFNLIGADEFEDIMKGNFTVDSDGWFTIVQSKAQITCVIVIETKASNNHERLILLYRNNGYAYKPKIISYSTNSTLANENGDGYAAINSQIDRIIYGSSEAAGGHGGALALNILAPVRGGEQKSTTVDVKIYDVKYSGGKVPAIDYVKMPLAPIAEDYDGNPIITVKQIYGSAFGEHVYANKNINLIESIGGPSVGSLYRSLRFNVDATIQGVYTILGDLIIDTGITLTVNTVKTAYDGPLKINAASAGTGGTSDYGGNGGNGGVNLFVDGAVGLPGNGETPGGEGKGFVVFNVFGNIINNGTINASGVHGEHGLGDDDPVWANGGGGGGAGGLVVLRVLGEHTKNIIGTITANGGNGGNGGHPAGIVSGGGGGGGGGGNVEIYSYGIPDTSLVSVTGGTGGTSGGDGNAGSAGTAGAVYLVNYHDTPDLISQPRAISSDNDARFYMGVVTQYLGGWKVD